MDLNGYYRNRIVRWAGRVVRMPLTRAPRQLFSDSRGKFRGIPTEREIFTTQT